MAERIELPVTMPYFTTYHWQGSAGIVAAGHPQAAIWYWNNAIVLECGRRFLRGFTSPECSVPHIGVWDIPFFEKHVLDMRFLQSACPDIFRDALRQGYYLVFSVADDFCIKGTALYDQRHFDHDGLISGMDDEQKTVTLIAYDSHQIYRPFHTPLEGFRKGMAASCQRVGYGIIVALKVKHDSISLDLPLIRRSIEEYLDSDFERYPSDEDGAAYGLVVHDYLALYLERLRNGSIPLGCLDRRPFRLIWEHKRCMLDRILAVEQALGLDDAVSRAYAPLAKEANRMHFIYAKYNQKPQAELLSLLQRKLAGLKEKERYLLTELVERMSAA